jgi:hypothetical protein
MSDLKHVLGPLIALAILAVIGFQTADALQHSGSWAASRRTARVVIPDPYARLEAQLSAPAKELSIENLRDPFDYPRAPVANAHTPPRPHQPPPPPMPVLTAILADSDPRALIRYQDRNYTLKTGDHFVDLKVVSITADRVVLDRNGLPIVLRRPTKGE